MPEFVSLDPAAEVLGSSLLGVLGALPPEIMDRGEALLSECGVCNPQAGSWYSLPMYLEWLRRMQLEYGSELLLQVAWAIPATSRFPPEIRDLHRALRTLDVAYHLNHRGGDIGMYLFHISGPTGGEMHCQTPYGCAFDQGILQGLGNRFLPVDSELSLCHKSGTACRKNGAEACEYLLSW